MVWFNYHDFKLNGNKKQGARSSSFGQGFPKPVTTSTLFSSQSSVFGARSSAMQESPQFQNLNRQSAGNMQRYASQGCFGQRAGQTQNASQMWNAQAYSH